MFKINKVFLGGTCSNTTWRDELIPKLKIGYFNPVVDNWNGAAQENERREKKNDLWQLYVITPQIEGYFSIAEVVDNSHKDPEHTIFCVLEKDGDKEFNAKQLKSLQAIKDMIVDNGAIVCDNLDDIALMLNMSYDDNTDGKFTFKFNECVTWEQLCNLSADITNKFNIYVEFDSSSAGLITFSYDGIKFAYFNITRDAFLDIKNQYGIEPLDAIRTCEYSFPNCDEAESLHNFLLSNNLV